MNKFVALWKWLLSLEHGVLVLLWLGGSIGWVSGLMHACWIIRTNSAEQLLCHFERDARRALHIAILPCR